MTPLIEYLLHLGDNALILGQRNSEWCGHGPVLEQDIAITNISLDLIGQARNFYQYAAELSGGNTTEDTLAYLRDNRDFRNILLVELERGDWAVTTLRQFFFSSYQLVFFEALQKSADARLAAIAEKSIKEVNYHTRWSSEWVIRLADGTEESLSRLENAFSILWPYTGEMFLTAPYEKILAEQGIAPDPAASKQKWNDKLVSVFAEAGISLSDSGIIPTTINKNIFMQTGGKQGVHTEKLGYILAEMQFLQRTYPGCEW